MKQPVAGMLQRQVHIVAHLGQGRVSFNQFIGKSIGIRIQNPDPFQPFQIIQIPEQFRQPQFTVTVLAVAGSVLGNDHQFLHPTGDQFTGFRHNLFVRLAHVTAPDERNSAEGAEIIASFRDFKVSHVRSRGQFAGICVKNFFCAFFTGALCRTGSCSVCFYNFH